MVIHVVFHGNPFQSDVKKNKKKTGFRVEVRLSVIVKKVLFHSLHGLHNLLTGLNGFQVFGDEFVVTFGQ